MRAPDPGPYPRIHQLCLNLMDCRVKPQSMLPAIDGKQRSRVNTKRANGRLDAPLDTGLDTVSMPWNKSKKPNCWK